MAELYLAIPIEGGEPSPQLVAIKRMLPHLEWDPEFVRMFLDEVRIAASLSHPNIVQVLDFGIGEGGHYLAMEYLHGWSLRELLGLWSAPIPLEVAVGIVREVARGLDAVHEHRDASGCPLELVHRDVSPSNVMLTADGEIKLLDFGIAKVSERTQLTRAGVLKGKIGYMSPEQCRGGRLDRRSDIFCLGILLYELTLGRRAFSAGNDYAVLGKIIDGDVTRPSEIDPHYPTALESIVSRALAVDVSQRYSTASAMERDLRAFADAAAIDCSRARRHQVLSPQLELPTWPEFDVREVRSALRGERSGQRRRRVAAGLVALGLGAGASAALYQRAAVRYSCEREADAVAAVWDEARSASIAEAFDQSGVGYAAETWRRAAPRVDDWAQQWQEQRLEACVEGERDHSLSAQTLARTRRCLDLQLTGVRVLTDQWADPDELVVRATGTTAWSLPSPAECHDERVLQTLGVADAPTSSPDGDASLRRRLAEVDALLAVDRYQAALSAAREVLNEARADPQSRIVVMARLAIGRALERLGHFRDAVESLEEAFRAAESIGDDIHAFDAAALLTRVMGGRLDRFSDGLAWAELAVAKRRRLMLEPDDPRVATLASRKGLVYMAAGRFDDAEHAHREALSIRERALGVDHPHVTDSLNGLANTLSKQARYGEALEAYEQVIARYRATLGPDHPRVASALNGAAVVLDRTGETARAKSYFEKARVTYERALGPRHLDLAMVLNNLGTWNNRRGHHRRAIEHHRHALEIREEILGTDHPDIAVSLVNLSEAYRKSGRYDDAISTQHRALSILERSLGADHLTVSASLASLAQAYEQVGRFDEALEVGQRALDIRQAALAPDHPTIAGSMNNQANLLRVVGRYDEAEALLRSALSSYEKALGPAHPNVGIMEGNLGEVLTAQGRYDEAWRAYARAISLFESRGEPEHAIARMSLVGMSEIDIERRRFDAALPRLERVLAMHERNGASPDELARAWFAAARAQHGKGRTQRALPLARRAIAKATTASLRQDVEAWVGTHR